MNQFVSNNPLKFTIKDAFIFLLLFFLIYVENHVKIGPVKLTELWKTPLIFILIIYALHTKTRSLPRYIIFALLFFIKSFLIVNFTEEFSLYNVSIALKFLFFPFLAYYLSQRFKQNLNKIREILLKSSIFFIISTIPFHVNLLPQLSISGDMTRFGIEGQSYFTSFFENAGNASKMFVFSSTIIMSYYIFFKANVLRLSFYWLLLLITVYSLYVAFMRTGWFTFIIAIFLIMFYQRKTFSLIARIPMIVLLIFLIYDFYRSNEVIQMRINDLSVSRVNRGVTYVDPEQRASGRFLMAKAALENISNYGVYAVLLGYDAETAFEEMYHNIGIRVGAHNYLIDTLTLNGLIGLLLWFLIMFEMYKIYFSNYYYWKGDTDIRMGQIVFIIYLILNFFSGGASIWGDILLGIITALVVVKKQSLKNNVSF